MNLRQRTSKLLTKIKRWAAPASDGMSEAPGLDMHALFGAALLFFEAQVSGRLPPGHRIKWRGDSYLSDGSSLGFDLSGGWFDAGDHLKLVFPMCWTVTQLAWAVHSARGELQAHSVEGLTNLEAALRSLRHGLAFLAACHLSDDEFVAQVGDVDRDHSSCERAEKDTTTPRPVLTISPSRPGSDLAAAAAAAFAACSVALAPSDAALAQDALQRSRRLYSFAIKHQGCYSDSLPQCGRTYRSDNWQQYAMFAAAWLFAATAEPQFRADVARWQEAAVPKSYWPDYSWASVYFGACALMLSLTNEDRYREKLEYFCDSHRSCKNGVKRTPCGLTFVSKWGSCRHAAGAAAIMAVYARAVRKSHPDDAAAALAFAQSQVRYFYEGAGHSWVVGFGKRPPLRPHHRDSALKMSQSGDWNAFNSSAPNAHVLVGAMVGGPDEDGRWADDRTDYIGNEVALDYNAALVLALAQCMPGAQ